MKRVGLFFIMLLTMCYWVHAQDYKDSTHGKEHKHVNTNAMKFEIPASLKEEHKELHESLEKFTKLPGKTGAAARELAKVLHPHFVKEEEYALPPLGLLADLAKSNISNEMKPAIDMSEKLKKDFQQMIAEHQQIAGVLLKLRSAAEEEHYKDVKQFTYDLILHAKTEEQVLYPAAILVGEYLKLKL